LSLVFLFAYQSLFLVFVFSSLTRICDQKKKLISKKKIPGYENISDLMSATFEPPVKLIKETSASVGLDVHEIAFFIFFPRNALVLR
jgi:hypothetical protein